MDPLVFVVILALIALIIAMLLGILAMGSGGLMDKTLSTPLMWARVGIQGFAILVLLLALFMRG